MNTRKKQSHQFKSEVKKTLKNSTFIQINIEKEKGVSDCDSCFDHAPFSTKVCCYYMMTHSIFSLLNQSIDCDDGEDNKQSPDQG